MGTAESETERKETAHQESVPLTRAHRHILFSVPVLFGLNALVWNYLPLISSRIGTTSLETSLTLIAFLRLPGILSGFRLSAIKKRIPLESIVIALPLATLFATAAFVFVPSVWALCLLILVQGLVAGLYWPADYSLRATLPSQALIQFNTMAVRRFAIVQFVACILALAIYGETEISVPLLVVGMAAVLAMSLFGAHVTKLKQASPILALLVIMSGCKWPATDHTEIHVRTFSISKDMKLSPNLTFAAMTVLNDTSAHFFRINKHLTIEGDAIRKYEQIDGGKTFRFYIDPDYRTPRHESLSSADVLHTIRQYLVKNPELAGPFKDIVGGQSCESPSCELKGFKIVNDLVFELTLVRPDLRLPEKLSSPWLVILKKDRPQYESIGECVLPYQTGQALVVECSSGTIKISLSGKYLRLSTRETSKEPPDKEIVAEAPGLSPAATLTSLSVFANPQSTLPDTMRIHFLTRARQHASTTAKALNLRTAPLYASGWLAVPIPSEIIALNQKVLGKMKCPARDVRVLLDTSLPQLDRLKDYIQTVFGCTIQFTITQADTYFTEFESHDFGIAWFTPDFLDIANTFGPFDCGNGAACNFNWKDKELERLIRNIRSEGENGRNDTASAAEVELLFFRRGYVAPIAEMNWWIKSKNSYAPIHPAGLFQVRLKDFL